jgi:hypothetical protein
MSENDTELVQILPFSSEKKEEGEEEDGSPIRSIFCLKSKSPADIKRIEEIEDCFILEFDPYESIDLSKFTVPADADGGASDLFVIAEKGQVCALRSFGKEIKKANIFLFSGTKDLIFVNFVCLF